MRHPTLFDRPPPTVPAPIAATARPTARRVNPGKGVALVHDCGICGAPNAPYGFGVDLREALRTGDRARAGIWLCRDCRDAR